MRVCILTRDDLFPANHGAAVKITQTAKQLSLLEGEKVCIVTSNRDTYWVCEQGVFEKKKYTPKIRAAQEWFLIRYGNRLAQNICRKIGYPEEEFFLYSAQFDPAWWGRVLGVGFCENIDVFQAEFPGYGIAAYIASSVLGLYRQIYGGAIPISSIVQHNVEWDRLREFGISNEKIRTWEIRALSLVDEIIAVSQDDKKRMVKSGILETKITVVPHGVDVSSFETTTDRNFLTKQLIEQHLQKEIEQQKVQHMVDAYPNDINRDGISYDTKNPAPKIFFFHGTLHYWPNTEAVQFIATKLIPQIEEIFDNFYFVIVGMNPPLYFAHPKIIFTGAVEQLHEYIALADVCVCPLFSGGGTRLKLLEYMAAGKNIVSTKKGAEGIPHQGLMTVLDEQCFESQDDLAQMMAQEILFSLQNNGQNGREREKEIRSFAQKYDWKHVTKGYSYLYRGLHRGENWYDILQNITLVPQNTIDITSHLPPNTKKSKPRTLLFLINEGCNLRCEFCDLWSHFEHIPIERVEPIFRDARNIETKTVVLTGGEPLLHPDCFEIIQLAKRYGFDVNMTTNGTLVEKYWQKIVDSGIDSLSFSIDGLEATHDQIRGQKGAFGKTWKAIQRIKQETNIDCSVYFVVTNKNVGELVDVFDRVHQLGVRFDFWPVNDAEDMYIQQAQDQNTWHRAVSYIAQKEPSIQERLPFYQEALRYHNHELKGSFLRCLGFVDQYGIKYDGSFLPCCVWGGQNLVVGNIFVEGLENLWYSATVQKYRQNLYSNGCDAGCYNHSLYEFMSATGTHFVVSKSK